MPPRKKAVETALTQQKIATPVARDVGDQLIGLFGKSRVVAALDYSDNIKAAQLLALLSDPANADKPFTALYRKLGLTTAEVLGFVTDMIRNQGLFRLYEQLGDVLADIAADSKTKEFTCAECDGRGKVMKQVTVQDPDDAQKKLTVLREWTCSACYGERTIRITGNENARKLMLEALGMVGQKGPLIAQQINIGGVSQHEDTMRITQKLIDSGG